ncbi:MAG: MarR family winged helix-turn-helix transcriptional regulator [Sporomusaceae bacterium]|nr:MarR family winged helix-turn-helix transcriptional regulator [Sporomusaceae bacterium]
MKQIKEVYPKTPSPCYCLNLRRSSRALTQFYDDTLKASGLTTAQMSLLKHIQLSETSTISELAKTVRIDRTTLNRNMKPLIEAGFIAVKPGKDMRTKLIVLTESGQTALAEGLSLWNEAQDALKEYMGTEALDKLVELLSKLEAIAP